jgi:GT2 family glycosyltransferase
VNRIGATGAVVIGRNEGQRLVRCLESLRGQVRRLVYVDSGSTDGSADRARALGAEVLELDSATRFTAARARNEGFAHLSEDPELEYVQFVDGDCEIVAGWLSAAAAFLDSAPSAAIVAGRLKERFPEASIYNRLADAEWDRPAGKAQASGGNMMARASAISASGGFNPDLIAGEEPELCLRLRRSGWEIWQIDEPMAFHDIGMTRFPQWWTRTVRAGHTYAEGAALHGRGPERYNVARERSALVWGAGVPAVALLGSVVTPWALVVLLLWPLQVVRMKMKGNRWERAFFMTLAKIAEAQGVIGYRLAQIRGRTVGLIEYK